MVVHQVVLIVVHLDASRASGFIFDIVVVLYTERNTHKQFPAAATAVIACGCDCSDLIEHGLSLCCKLNPHRKQCIGFDTFLELLLYMVYSLTLFFICADMHVHLLRYLSCD